MIAEICLALGDYDQWFAVEYTYTPAERPFIDNVGLPETPEIPESVEIELVWLAGTSIEMKAKLKEEDAGLYKRGLGRFAIMPRLEAKILDDIRSERADREFEARLAKRGDI